MGTVQNFLLMNKSTMCMLKIKIQIYWHLRIVLKIFLTRGVRGLLTLHKQNLLYYIDLSTKGERKNQRSTDIFFTEIFYLQDTKAFIKKIYIFIPYTLKLSSL